MSDVAIWAVPFGLVGGRLYHVITDNDLYFGAGRRPIEALFIWNGGLGIWGAIALGALGAWIGARRREIRLAVLADALAPGLLLAQALGRFGNYFNQELFGRPTTLPWGLEISPEKRPPGFGEFATFHPTFLYEAVWNVIGMALIIWLGRRFALGHGRVFALYVMWYCAGRSWIEMLRIDTIELNDVLGLRWGVWMSIVLFLLALGYFVRAGRHGPREESPYDPERRAAWLARTEPGPDAETDTSTTEADPAPDEAR
ncbi:hypothetical protein LUZ63_020506 [Rhynchospora breviuscula]|uniref:Prolipoprotein diacylglyceryl transferase n=1 Tax=Rhynchospora breviuscula TaxID=2022672 RepID=A0A9Q0C0N6_9POAL|nr:hypothetical protein LUZ63_020506 [Rhynchospora breviuscula]